MSETPSNINIWNTEWASKSDESQLVPGHLSDKPSEAIIKFVSFSQSELEVDFANSDCLDIGCGLGRNAMYLSSVCANVTGVDYSPDAIEECRARASALKINNATFFVGNIASQEFSIINNSKYDIAIDSLTSTSVSGLLNRETFANNVHNSLNYGGVLLVRAVSTEDEFESQLMQTNPGPEPHSSIWPQSGKFQKNFSLDELIDMYKNLELLVAEKEHKSAVKMGVDFTATNWWVIFKKMVN